MPSTGIIRGHVRRRLKEEIMEMRRSPVLPFNSESQSSADHTYVQDSRLPDACRGKSPSLQMNAPLDIILIKVQSIFSSFCLQQCIKRFLHQSLALSLFLSTPTSLTTPPVQIERKALQGWGEVEGCWWWWWWWKVVGG